MKVNTNSFSQNYPNTYFYLKKLVLINNIYNYYYHIFISSFSYFIV